VAANNIDTNNTTHKLSFADSDFMMVYRKFGFIVPKLIEDCLGTKIQKKLIQPNFLPYFYKK
jgi:hypothetical protein